MRGNKHPAPARRHPQSWGTSRCIGLGQGNTGIYGFMGPRSLCGPVRAKKTLKRLKRPAGKGALFSGGFFHLHRYFQRARAKLDHPRPAEMFLRDMVTFITGKNKGKQALGSMDS